MGKKPALVTSPSPESPIPSLGSKKPVIMVIGSLGWSLINFRLNLLCAFRDAGYDVLAVAPELDAEVAAELERHDIRHACVPMNRTGLNPAQDVRLLRALIALIRRERPAILFPYTMKPIIYGCLAASLTRQDIRQFPLFTGLGYAFTYPHPKGKRRLVRRISIMLHRIALRRVEKAFYYNQAEYDDIRHFGMVPKNVPLMAIPGTGVDTARFELTDLPQGPIRFLFVGRMLRTKGVAILAEAAQILRDEGLDFTLGLLGPSDSNPDAIDKDTLATWQQDAAILWFGETRDVRPYLDQANVVVLPTMLREGLPRTILEAMAAGRAVITTNVPGCRETVVDEVTGLLVPPGDAPALAAAMRRFIQDPALAERMGKAARERVCARHDVHVINHLLLTEMGLGHRIKTPSPTCATSRAPLAEAVI